MTHFFDESFVIAVCFFVFLYFAYRPIKNAIIASLDARIAEIKADVAKSQELRIQAENLLDQVKKELQDVHKLQETELESAESKSRDLMHERMKEIDAIFSQKKSSLGQTLDYETEKLLKNLQLEFGQKTIAIVRQYLEATQNNHSSDQELIEYFLKQQAD